MENSHLLSGRTEKRMGQDAQRVLYAHQSLDIVETEFWRETTAAGEGLEKQVRS